MTKSNGIASLKQAAKLLNKHSPDGESLAYINKDEAKLLRSHGGSGIQTLSTVPSYLKIFGFDVPFTKEWLPEVDIGKKAWDWMSGPYKAPTDSKGKPIYNEKTGERIGAPRSIVQDAMSIWVGLRAKKEQEGLNAAEMEQFNKLNQQLSAAETEFDVGTDFGQQLKPEYKTDITESAAYTPIDFSGQDTPELITTPIATPAEGGRIGAFNGGIQGLMPQQGFMPQPGLMPQQGLDPRMGYNRGRVVNPGGYAGEKFDLANLDSLQGLRDPFVPGRIDREGEGFYQDDLTGVRDPFKTSPEMIEIQKDYDIESMRDPFTPSGEMQKIQKLVQEIMKLYEDIEVKDAIGLARQILESGNYDIGLETRGQAQGGRIGAQGGGIMPLLDMGGMEKDYRQDGGFVPIGRKEKADDVPARLSKNEFVFTADAVKAAGGGDIDQGAQRMYNVMKNLEAGGEISEQSQGQG